MTKAYILIYTTHLGSIDLKERLLRYRLMNLNLLFQGNGNSSATFRHTDMVSRATGDWNQNVPFLCRLYGYTRFGKPNDATRTEPGANKRYAQLLK
jgi:hypothetical protein